MFFTNGSGRAAIVKNVEPPNKVKPVGAAKRTRRSTRSCSRASARTAGNANRLRRARSENRQPEQRGAGRRTAAGADHSDPAGRPGPGPGVTTTGSTEAGGRAGGGDGGRTRVDDRYRRPARAGSAARCAAARSAAAGRAAARPQQQGSPVRIAALPQQQATTGRDRAVFRPGGR